jgi:hypothetical protein
VSIFFSDQQAKTRIPGFLQIGNILIYDQFPYPALHLEARSFCDGSDA